MSIRRIHECHPDSADGVRRVWGVVGHHGALHLWATEFDFPGSDRRYYGGLEIHYRKPPEYMRGDPPSQNDCWLLEAPCWHDGSSLVAEEVWIPWWRGDPDNHDRVLDRLEQELAKRFADCESEAQAK